MSIKFLISCNLPGQEGNIRNAIFIFFPYAGIKMLAREEEPQLAGDEYRLYLCVQGEKDFHGTGIIKDHKSRKVQKNIWDREILDPRYNESDWATRKKEVIRLLILHLLKKVWRQKTPWGTLTGIRPLKHFRYLADKGFKNRELKAKLKRIYDLASPKIDLLFAVDKNQRKVEPPIKSRPEVSLYVHIPFCPTRCAYCSFPAYALATHGKFVQPYLDALWLEIQEIGLFLSQAKLTVDSLYCGGGTPTSLDDYQFTALLSNISKFLLVGQKPREITIEAGRPETLSEAKLAVMKKYGVTRVCVNPQTTKQSTLERMGRYHTLKDVEKAVYKVRKAGIEILNMDLIAGLPGEDIHDFMRTLKDVLRFEPENLTIHTLAIKRAAVWHKELLEQKSTHTAEKMLEQAEKVLANRSYEPYYLYRQRFIQDDQENIGYARAGKFCRYNIVMMEEEQEVIGVGAGAVTRLFAKEGGYFRLTNQRCPATYTKMIPAQITKKVKMMLHVFS